MNRRISPDDLDSAPYKESIQTMVFRWIQANLPANELTFTDYVRSVRTLLLTTQNLDRTVTIVQAVLDQAVALGKTSEWVDQELKFEGMIEGADRADFLLLELHQTDSMDDTLLDQYNERINRFSTNNTQSETNH